MEPEEVEDSINHIIPRTPFPQYIDDALFLEVQGLLSQHPTKAIRDWSENPRVYTLLRLLGYHDNSQVLKKFHREEISDFWLPLSDKSLQQLSSTEPPLVGFRGAERHVLSKPEQMSEEKLLIHPHKHRHIRNGSSHFEKIDHIGEGGSADVLHVRHKSSGRQFALKCITRAETLKRQKDQLVEFVQEVSVLQRVSHKHFVTFVASFTDSASFSLVLSPVAKDVLNLMLERQSREQPLADEEVKVLRHSFYCLATALASLHEQHVRHKDIKPGNILLNDGRVYLCDFGIARDWSKSDNSTTEGNVLKFTRRYCAPEVFGHDPRNTKSDIWSLGCVFLEVISVIKGYPLEDLNSFLMEHSTGASAQGLWWAPEAMHAWLVKIRSENNDSADDLPLDWIMPMIRPDAEDRPTAADIVNMIHKQTVDLPHPGLFLAPCCSRSDSIMPIEVSPTVMQPNTNRWAISNAPTTPRGQGHEFRHPARSPTSSGEDSRRLPRRTESSSDRSVSPRTRSSFVLRDSTATVAAPADPIVSPPNRQLQHIASRSSSNRTSSLSFPQLPESLASSTGARKPPIPPLTGLNVMCACAPRVRENHILNCLFASCNLDSSIPTVETCATCEVGENRVQIYETLPERSGMGGPRIPMLWWITRRLVISYLSGSPERRRCSSFWVPLTDLQFSSSGNEVVLRWSDCNQLMERQSGNWEQHCDWLYDPEWPNNQVMIQFNNTTDADSFIDTIRLPYEDGVIVSRGRKIDVSPVEELRILDVGRKGVRNYRVAVRTIVENDFAHSKLFIRWPELDLDIHIPKVNRFTANEDYRMIVRLNNVSTPTYHSDVRGEPAVDSSKVAKFSRAHQLKSFFSVTFPLGRQHNLPAPPPGVVEMMHALTGWSLRYFAFVVEIRSKRKRLGHKKYGRADIMLWERELDGHPMRRYGSQITFRLHEETDFLWITGAIAASSSITYSTACDATITIANRARGRLIDCTKMAAIASEHPREANNGHTRSISNAQEELSELLLTFEDPRYRLEFVNVVERFKEAAAATAPLQSTSSLSDSVSRINSLASSEHDPPMR